MFSMDFPKTELPKHLEKNTLFDRLSISEIDQSHVRLNIDSPKYNYKKKVLIYTLFEIITNGK